MEDKEKPFHTDEQREYYDGQYIPRNMTLAQYFEWKENQRSITEDDDCF